MKTKPRLLRVTTVPISLKLLLRGQLSFFQQHGYEVLAVSADGPEIQSLRQDGIAHLIVPMTRTISPVRDLVSLLRLVLLIKKFRPHIIHTHTPKAGLLGMVAGWICRTPVRMHTVAGMPLMERSGLIKKILIITEKITYACATSVYPNSPALNRFIASSIPTKTPVKVISKGSTNGIDTSYFSPSEKLYDEAKELRKNFGIGESDIIFSFIGRIVRDKGINELLQAFDQMSVHHQAYLLLAGPFENDLDPISENSRKILARNAHVITLGYVDDIRPMLQASDVFVFPSYREGFPNVVLQACCMKCACIVSDINGCNEIISHGLTGLTVKPKDAEALQNAMLFLADNPALRKNFSEQARKYVIDNFEQRNIWNELLNEYRILLNVKSELK